LIYANFPRSYRVFFFFSTVSFAPALLLLRRPVMASADAPVMDLIFFFFTNAAFLHITPFFVNPSVYSFFLFGRAARVQLPSPGPFGPSSH
jgi:hypothetical protein